MMMGNTSTQNKIRQVLNLISILNLFGVFVIILSLINRLEKFLLKYYLNNHFKFPFKLQKPKAHKINHNLNLNF